MRRVGSSRSSSVWRHLISITDEIVGGQRTKEISKGKIRYAEITAKEIPKRERNPKEGIGSAEFQIRGNRKPQPTSPLTAIFTRVPRLSDLTWCYTPVLPRCPPGVIHRCPPHKCFTLHDPTLLLGSPWIEVAHFFACQSAEPLSVRFTARTPAPITSGPEISQFYPPLLPHKCFTLRDPTLLLGSPYI